MTGQGRSRTGESTFGAAKTRLEGADKVTGAARYSGDFDYPGLAHGWLVVSTVARGRVRDLNADELSNFPGVLEVLHHGNCMRLVKGVGWPDPDPNLQVFQDDRVPHAGWPIALVVAETPEQARAAAQAARVDYEVEPFDVVFAGDHPGLYTPQEVNLHKPSTIVRGNVDAELSRAEVLVDRTYWTPEEHHNAMEPHVSVARWVDGHLIVDDSNQGPRTVAENLAELFALDLEHVRVRTDHVGGGFGSKAAARVQSVLASLAAITLGRPVRVVLTRTQMFGLVGYRPPTEQRVRLGARPDGRIRGYEHDTATQTSTLFEYVEPAGLIGGVMYAADALRITHKVVKLDVPTPRWMRGPGEAPGSFALECAIDELAEECGIDPIELRVRNEPSVAPGSGTPFSSRNLVSCFERGADQFGWADRDPQPGIRRQGRWLLGTGVAAGSYPGETAPSTAQATAEPDGSFSFRIAAVDIGTGARTALAQIAADAMGVPLARIRMSIGDSDHGPAMLAGHSMGTTSWGWAISTAAVALTEKIAGLESIPADGVSVQVGTGAALRAAPKNERHAFAAQFAEVAVDTLSGEVRVRRMLGVYAIGRVVNALMVRSQLTGGMTWGISMALHEEAVRDAARGTHVNANLAGYHYAASADVPVIDVDWVDDVDLENPTGIKGAGEVGIAGAAAAVANAVWHATGVRHYSLPLSLERVLEGSARKG